MRIIKSPLLKKHMVGLKGKKRPFPVAYVSKNIIDSYYMRKAITEAERAENRGDVPVGAIIVNNGKVIAKAGNRVEIDEDVLKHAEMICIRKAQKLLGRRLNSATLYVTLEPCVMCAGAIVNAKLKRVVFGAYDKERGGCGSMIDVIENPNNLYHVDVTSGILKNKNEKILKNFFEGRRKENRAKNGLQSSQIKPKLN